MGYDGLRRLAAKQLVDGFNFNCKKQISFSEACTKGKQHRSHFPVGGSEGMLDLVHTNVCGKLNSRSVGAEYSVTFVDDKSTFVWVYILKSKG